MEYRKGPTYYGQIKAVKRLPNTAVGNPRYAITLGDGTTLNTAPNTSYVYDLQNIVQRADGGVGRHVAFEVDGRGRITAIEAI